MGQVKNNEATQDPKNAFVHVFLSVPIKVNDVPTLESMSSMAVLK